MRNPISRPQMMNSSTQYNSASQPCCFIFYVVGWLILIKMNKLKQIAQNLKDNPTLYDYYSYSKPWTIEEKNQIMMAEYLSDVQELATQMDRSEYSVILKFLELRNDLDDKLAFDAQVISEEEAGENWEVTDYPLSDFQPAVSVVNCKSNEVVRVNIRLLDEAMRQEPPSGLKNRLAHFMTMPSENACGGGLFGVVRTTAVENVEYDPDRFGILKFKPNRAGYCQIGYEIKEHENDPVGIKKTIFINVVN